MGRRSDHTREELQQLIIDATLKLVTDKGADKVTARQIAKAVGYTPGMLYSVFENQQEIFLHVNILSLDALHHQCAKASKKKQTPEKIILSLGLAYLAFAQNNTHQFNLLFTRTQSAPNKPLHAQIHSRINALFKLIEQQLEILAPHHSKVEVQVGARALWSGVHGAASLALAGQFYMEVKHPDREVINALIYRFLESWQL